MSVKHCGNDTERAKWRYCASVMLPATNCTCTVLVMYSTVLKIHYERFLLSSKTKRKTGKGKVGFVHAMTAHGGAEA
jgi:hypothetical protein